MKSHKALSFLAAACLCLSAAPLPVMADFSRTNCSYYYDKLDTDAQMLYNNLYAAALKVDTSDAYYAYAPSTGEATVRVEKIDGGVTLTFIDSGVAYNPLEQKEPDVTLSAEERQVGGLGIFLVKKTMDDMTYRREDGKNILTIRKNFTK